MIIRSIAERMQRFPKAWPTTVKKEIKHEQKRIERAREAAASSGSVSGRGASGPFCDGTIRVLVKNRSNSL
ncbi:MAG TPA: hypothetical protein VEI57_01645 [Nitrospirota bacterium]|nr:hypothetical protein [Nitrospirota bacterium]